MHSLTNKQLIFLGASLIAIVLLATIFGTWPSLNENESVPISATVQLGQNNVRIPPPQPPMTAADTIQAQNAQPFQVLISYVNSGFEPSSATIKVGQTVRFTNNSTGELWVAASGDKLYPAVQNGCGSSALDSCSPLQPGDFWQFTFMQSGSWSFENNLDKSQTGTVIVQVE